MNTIKFSNILNATTEQHDLEVETISEENFYENEITLKHPCNLNLFITNMCQNDCFFCINGRHHLFENEISTEKYFASLEQCLFDLQGKEIEITITGGEPTLYPVRFVRTMELCKKYGYPCRTVSTTGFKLMEDYKGKALYQHMLENDFIHNINISRMHFDEEKNKELLKGNNLTNEEVSKLAMFFSTNNAEMRVSCNIINGYIDSMDKMLQYVSYFNSLGVDTVMFRELVMDNPLLLPSILNFDGFNFIETLSGDNYEVDVWTYKNFLVKHYRTVSKNDNAVSSLSLNNGILRIGFNGKVLKKY